MRNRLTVLLIGVALAAASGTAAAHSNVSFGISIGVPAYVAPVPAYRYAPPPVVYYPPAPVYYAPPPPVYYAPAYYYDRPGVVIRYRRGGGHRHHW